MWSPLNLFIFVTSALALTVQKDARKTHHLPRQLGTWTCGDQPYSPLEYTCFGDKLCPYNGAHPLLACGDDCYDPLVYDCSTNGTLVQASVKAVYTGIAALLATTASEVDLLPRDSGVVAQAGRLTIGGDSSSNCPGYIDEKACPLFENVTETWLSATTLATVLSGQHLYIQTDGTVAFSSSGDIGRIDQLYDGLGSIYLSEGDYVGSVVAPNSLLWQACSFVDGTLDYLELRVLTPGLVDLVSSGELDCEDVTLEAYARVTSEPPFSAWQYS